MARFNIKLMVWQRTILKKSHGLGSDNGWCDDSIFIVSLESSHQSTCCIYQELFSCGVLYRVVAIHTVYLVAISYTSQNSTCMDMDVYKACLGLVQYYIVHVQLLRKVSLWRGSVYLEMNSIVCLQWVFQMFICASKNRIIRILFWVIVQVNTGLYCK